jgi:hypothetical protein
MLGAGRKLQEKATSTRQLAPLGIIQPQDSLEEYKQELGFA